MSDDDPELERRSEAYLDGIFGPGAGARHSAFLRSIESGALREQLHRCHLVEGDERALSIVENYLIGVCVLCAVRSFGPAMMFAKTLLHLGVPKEKILEAVARLAMWIGPVPAADAALYIQKAIREYEQRGVASLEAWFPEKKG